MSGFLYVLTSLFVLLCLPVFYANLETRIKHKLISYGGSATCARRPNGLCRVCSPLKMRHVDLIFSHVHICWIAYLRTVPYILFLTGQFRLWRKDALGNFSGSEWQEELHFWSNLTWISKNPVSKLHKACSCLPNWLVCDHFIPKNTKRIQEAE